MSTQETIRISNMVCNCCVRVLREELEKRMIIVKDISIGKATIVLNHNEFGFEQLYTLLESLGMKLLTNKEEMIVDKIKETVIELVHHMNNSDSIIRKSDYLVEKLGINYQTMSKLFSKYEPITLEKFIILHKIERIKELIFTEEYTLSEIAYMMDYNSVHYLSSQFKKITGMTFTQYKENDHSERKPLNHLY